MPTKPELIARCDQLEKDNRELLNQLARMERELAGKLLPEELPPEDFPTPLRALQRKHKLPWEVFWCYEHSRWLDELCSSFPYDISGTCPACRGEGGGIDE